MSHGKPPGEDIHLAPNYKKGGVWFRMGDLPRKLLSPDDARSVAATIEDKILSRDGRRNADGYETADVVAKLRDLADDVETDDADPDDFDTIPLSGGAT